MKSTINPQAKPHTKVIFTFLTTLIPMVLMGVICSGTSLASGQGTSTTAKLNLDTVMEAALENNLSLKSSRMTPQKKKENIQVATSIFDPVVSVKGSSSDMETWDESIDTTSLQFSTRATVSKLMPTGTEVSLSLEAADSNTDTDDIGDTDTDHVGDTGGSYMRSTLSVTHPLMKNRGEEVTRRNITLAENQYQQSEMVLKQTVMDTLAQAQTLYWRYYSSLESLTVYEQSLGLAQRFIEEVEMKVKIGSAAPLDIIQARSEVASRETKLITASNNVLNARDTLLNYIYGKADPKTEVECLTPPTTPSIDQQNFDEKHLIDQALALRIDYMSAGVDLHSSDVNLIYYKNQTQPELNLNAGVSINDAHADNEALQTSDYKNYYSGSVGVTLTFPWGLKGEKANYASAKLNKTQIQINRSNIKSRIILNVRTSLRDLTASVKRYETAQLASRYSRESLDAEQVKFRNGLSTTYNVLLYQRDLTNARVKEVDAVIACQTALIALYQAVGNTLEMNNITLEDSI